MFKRILILSAAILAASCSAPRVSDRQHGDLNIDCAGLDGKPLYGCAIQATGFAERVVRDLEVHCRRQGKHMVLSKVSGLDRQIINCKRVRPVAHARRTANGSSTPVLDPNSPRALTFGAKPSAPEMAQKLNIPSGGGIKPGAAVIMPTPSEWKQIVARASTVTPQLHVKSIQQGQSIADASRGRSQGSTALRAGRIPEISIFTKASTQHCKVIVDSTGEPVALRPKETGINRYVFRHLLNEEKYGFDQQKRKMLEAQAKLKSKNGLLDKLKTNITDNRAYRDGKCGLVKQRRIPPAPKRIDPKLIEMNAHGACVNLIGSTFTAEQVIEALESSGRWDITSNYQKWMFGNKMTCSAGVSISEFESFKTRAINWLAPNLGKEYFRKGIRTDLESCFSKVERRCDDGYDAWLSNKNRIIAEPRKLKNKCDADNQKLKQFDYASLAAAKSKVDEASKVLGALEVKQKTINPQTIIPFTDSRTYCKL